MTTAVIFLDIDGRLLNDLTKQTAAKIVVSSTWRKRGLKGLSFLTMTQIWIIYRAIWLKQITRAA